LSASVAQNRVAVFETRVAAAVAERNRRAADGRPQDGLHLVQLRAGVNELINDVMRSLPATSYRNDICQRAKSLVVGLKVELVVRSSGKQTGKKSGAHGAKRGRKKQRSSGGSVWTVGGGLPSLGKPLRLRVTRAPTSGAPCASHTPSPSTRTVVPGQGTLSRVDAARLAVVIIRPRLVGRSWFTCCGVWLPTRP
jgi:hypothetical protein